MRWIFGVVLVLTASACGGGGSGGSSESLSRDAQAAALTRQLAEVNIVDAGRLPTSGSARYNGFITANLPLGAKSARERYVGDLSLNVDFAAAKNQLSGRAENFATKNGQALGGALNVQGSTVFRNTDTDKNYTFNGDIAGDLTKDASLFDIEGDIDGEFRGRNQDGVTGLFFGDITGADGQDIFDGDFAAQKQ